MSQGYPHQCTCSATSVLGVSPISGLGYPDKCPWETSNLCPGGIRDINVVGVASLQIILLLKCPRGIPDTWPGVPPISVQCAMTRMDMCDGMPSKEQFL